MKDIGTIVKEIKNEFGQFCGGKACDHCKYDGADECKVAFAYDKGRAAAHEETLYKIWQIYEGEERTFDDIKARHLCNKIAEWLKENK